MNKSRFFMFSVVLALSLALVGMALAADNTQKPPPTEQVAFTGVAPTGSGVNSLSGSNVTFNPGAGGDTCYIPGATQTFCFNAHSYTNDWEYVYNVWLKFPTDWQVTNAYVVGTPACTGGGTWGTFSWSFQTAPYEMNISHARYQSTTDDCTATYCVEVVSGTGLPDAEQSWYWDGDGYGSTPHNPCSDDQYTPSGQNACDEWVNDTADIPPCAMDPGLYLLPESQEASGCNGVPQEHTISLLNNTGSAGTFNLTYSVPTADGNLTGPATVTANQMEVVPFVVTLTPDLCVPNGDVVVGQVDAAGNTYTDTAWVNKTIASEPGWEAITGSAPSWPGFGYPRDGCTAMNAAGDWVTYEIGDMSSFVGFWGYNHDTNTWIQPGSANTPPDRWAPDWAYDPDTNLCYVTGGANTPGGGTYNTAYVFDPVANSFTQLGNFTSIRDFHTSWVGTLDGVKYLCIGGGVNASSVLVQSTQCYDLAQAAPGSWNAENSQMAALPNDPFGAADGVLHAPGGDQFWYVGGAINNFATVTDEAYYWDDADNMWHSGGNTGVPRYRVEGDFLNGEFYLLGGSSGGFTPTSTAVKGTFDGVGWTWTNLPDMNNVRMDNVANMGDETMWSVDGYGASASAYVEKLTFCPLCDMQGWLEGTVLDGDTQLPLGGEGSCSAPESLTGSWVDLYPQAGGDSCFTPDTQQTLCFKAESFSPDYEYVYNVWLKFPSDWTVNNVYVAGTPWCDNGSWGSFSWSFETAPYEVNINHARYQGSGGANCIANYCFEVTTGNTGFASWYWDGDNYGSVPHHPCSSDQYTPGSMSAYPCDEWINPLATIPPCNGALAPTCTNASVTINPGNIHVGVDPATGHYGPVMLIQGVYTVTATAPGYSTEEAVVYIADEMTTTQDFALLRPAVAVDPTFFDVASPYNVPLTVQLDIYNNGSLPLDFEIREMAPTAGALAAKPQPVAATGVDPLILDQMAASADGKATFFVAFSGTADLASADLYTDKASKIEWVRNALRQAADFAQADVRAWLDSQGIAYQVFYIDNTLMLTADASVLEALKAFPGVSGFHGNHTYELLPYSTDHPSSTSGSLGLLASLHTVEPDAIIPWDLNIMSIPQVWDDLGITGEGVIVANVDTGVDYDHEALFPNYLCGAGPHTDCWLDPDGGSTTPNDGHGHGTGTMSQMAADNNPAFQYAVGDAPDAGWIACAGCPGGSCPDTALNACADWLVMTTPNTPDVVNNSWGTWSALCDPWYDGKIAAYRAAGIVPVWAAGNIGNACSTSTPPANSIGTLAVGATTSGDVQAGFSSTGPGLCTGRTQFPDVSAPGDATCGAVTGGGYTCGLGGTSFAAPRAAGCLALMKSANPSLGVQELMDVLMATADDKLNQDCGAPQNDPNYRYGEGRVNCFEAVSAVYSSDLPWVSTSPITGTIAPDTFQPVDVTFECTVDQVGQTLLGSLVIESNDPCQSQVEVPLSFFCQGNMEDPDIYVVAPPMESSQCPDTTTTIDFSITNVGGEDLTWSLAEMPGVKEVTVTPKTSVTERAVELKLSDSGGLSVETNPPVIEAPVTLVLDDGTVENNIGLGGTIEMLWVNRFTPALADFPFNLNQVQIYFDSTGLVNVGDDMIIIVYENTTGSTDPAVGSTFLASFPVTVQAINAWNVYDLPSPVLFNGPGDVIVGAIALELPMVSYWPAAMDQTATQARSWAGWWNTSPPPTPPVLPPPNWTLIDAYFPGNWMVRGYGETVGGFDVPWLSEAPTSGTLAPAQSVVVHVTFDSTGMAPGDYTAGLQISSNDPDTPLVDLPVAMTVYEPLSGVDFNYTPPDPAVGETVSFAAVVGGGTEPYSFTWDFGDGTTGEGQFVDHTYAAADDYLVSLTVENVCGSVTVEYTVHVADYPDIMVDPLALDAVQARDTVTSQQLDISNVGETDLEWDLMESSGLPEGLGDLLFEVQVENQTGNNLILGGEFAFGSYWFTGADPAGGTGFLYKFDTAGILVATYNQAPACTGWGGRDLAADGSFLYYGCDTGLIYQVDPATGAPTGTTIPAPIFPPRALAWDPSTDHFWTASWDSSLYEISRTGTVINTFAPVGLSTYGFAWDTWSPAGPFLWAWSQDGSDPLLQASQINPTTGALTGLVWFGTGLSGEMAGGAAISDQIVDGQLVFLGMNQGTPDRAGIYDMGVSLGCIPGDFPWLSFDPGAGVTPPAGTDTVDVTFDSTGLTAGTYTGYICVNSNDPDEGQIPVPVTLEVVPHIPEPEIVVEPLAITVTLFSNETGTEFFTIGNTGDADLTWSLAEASTWLSVLPASGTVEPGDTPTDVTVTFDSTGVAAGTYHATLTITSNDEDEPTVTVEATLIVENHTFFLPFLHK